MFFNFYIDIISICRREEIIKNQKEKNQKNLINAIKIQKFLKKVEEISHTEEMEEVSEVLKGRIAKKYCRKIFVTDDNPRNEDPKKIRNEIRKNKFKDDGH